MSILENRAASINENGARISVGPCEITEPGLGEVLVKNHAWGINPVDWKIQSFGVMLQEYPAVLGFEVAGEVVAVGEDVGKFEVGDRVMTHPLGLQTKRAAEDGFQLYTIAQSRAAVKIPDTISYAEAAKLPLGLLTASAALYNKEHLQLPLPNGTPQATGKALLLATASGVQVVAVASEKNRELVRNASAVAMFDHTDPNATTSIVDHLRGMEVIGAFDAIGSIEATEGAAKVLSHLGGGKLRSVFNRFASLDVTVEVKQVQPVSVFLAEPEIGRAVWEGFVPEALRTGQIKPLLRAEVVGHGLESIQAGIDVVKAGVSGTKVVVLAYKASQ